MDAVRGLRRKKVLRADPIVDSVAAVSVGLVNGKPLLDMCYEEDKCAEVDFTVVQTGGGRFVEVQGAAEAGTFSQEQMAKLLAAASRGIRQLHRIQQQACSRRKGR